MDNDGNLTIDGEDVFNGKNNFILMFFSASWCDPCNQFKVILKKFIDRDPSVIWKVLYVSYDSTEDKMKEEMHNTTWFDFAVYYGHHDLGQDLVKEFDIKGIPKLVVVDGAGHVLATEGRDDLKGAYNKTEENFSGEKGVDHWKKEQRAQHAKELQAGG